MSTDFFSKYTIGELQGYFSDFHKDFYGFRPRFGDEGSWNNREWLTIQINHIHDEFDHLKETFAGREELRSRGWIIEETDAELAKQAAWLEQERQHERDELDAKLNGDLV